MNFSKRCLICAPHNDTLYAHVNIENNDIWLFCCKCDRGYTVYDYCYRAGISMAEFLKQDFDFQESRPNEITPMEFPRWFVPLSDPRAEKGIQYLKSRGLEIENLDVYYDIDNEGIVLPLYYENVFAGAQVRFIVPRKLSDGDEWKMTTIPGTRIGLLFSNWAQSTLLPHIKAVIVTEGFFNAVAIQQALNKQYGGLLNNPFKVIGCNGSGGTAHHIETIKELKDSGLKIILAPDSDLAGMKMLKKFNDLDAITHYVITGDSDKDWNELLKDLGHEGLARYVLSSIKKV